MGFNSAFKGLMSLVDMNKGMYVPINSYYPRTCPHLIDANVKLEAYLDEV